MIPLSHFCQCPMCGADLKAGDIPQESLDKGYYGDERICSGCGGPRHFSRLIGISDWERDRTVEWLCPDCGARWPR